MPLNGEEGLTEVGETALKVDNSGYLTLFVRYYVCLGFGLERWVSRSPLN